MMRIILKMMTIDKILSYEPQIASIESGPEPCLEDLIRKYYAGYPAYFNDDDVQRLTEQYVNALYNKFANVITKKFD